jgi:Spy/CpxP family protein refolding chaperone
MQRSGLLYALILSLLLNFGVIGAAGYQAMRHGGSSAGDLADRLQLDAGQRQRWRALEEPFVRDLDAGWREIAQHREQLIRAVFSDHPDRARIEAERARIAELQAQQQRRVIAQFLQERDILSAEQRQALADLLLREAPDMSFEQRMHSR